MFRRRKILRLKGFDYCRPGAYFVTIVTQDWRKLFGRVAGGAVELTPAGAMVERVWRELPHRYDGVDIDEFVVMPDHFHGIVIIDPRRKADGLREEAHAAGHRDPGGGGSAAACARAGGEGGSGGRGGRPCGERRGPAGIQRGAAIKACTAIKAGAALDGGAAIGGGAAMEDGGRIERSAGIWTSLEGALRCMHCGARCPHGRPPAAARIIRTPAESPIRPAPAGPPWPAIRSLPDAIHRFKSFTTAEYRRGMRELGWPPIRRRLWLRSYWDKSCRAGTYRPSGTTSGTTPG